MTALAAPRGATEYDGLILREAGEVSEKVARVMELIGRVNGDLDGLTREEQAELQEICTQANRALSFIGGSVSLNLMQRRQSSPHAE